MDSGANFAGVTSALMGSPDGLKGVNGLEAPRESRMPLYLSLAQGLNQELRRGRWSGLEALPSERALSCMLAVSRETASKALNVLRERGLLTRRQGSGSYARAAVTGVLASAAQGSTEVPEASLVQRANADETLALGLRPDARVLRRRHLHLETAQGMSELCMSSLPLGTTDLPTPPAQLLNQLDLSAWFEAQGLGPTRVLQRVGVQAARADLAEALRVQPGAALLHITQIRYGASGQALEFIQRYRCGEAASYSAELRRNLKP